MLDVETPAGPLVHHLFELFLDADRIVVREPDHGHVKGGQCGCRIEVSTLLGLPDQTGPPPLELGDLAHVHECPESEAMDGVAFPGHAGAMVAEQCLGTVKRQLGLLPLTNHQSTDAPHHIDHAPGVRGIQLKRQVFGPPNQRCDASNRPIACRGSMGGFHGKSAGDPNWLACAKSKEQSAGLEVGSQNRVDHAQPRNSRPAEIDAGEILGRNLGFVARPKPETTEPEHGAMADQRQECRPGSRGHAQPEWAKDGSQQRQSLIHVAADEELRRGLSLQLQGFRRGRACGGLQADLRGLGPSSAVGQRIAQFLAKSTLAGRWMTIEFESHAVKPGSVIERQNAGSFVSGLLIEFAGAQAMSGSQEMIRQDFGLGLFGDFHAVGEPLVTASALCLREMCQYALAYPVVIDLDLIEPRRSDTPDQPRGAKRDQRNPTARAQFGSPEGE